MLGELNFVIGGGSLRNVTSPRSVAPILWSTANVPPKISGNCLTPKLLNYLYIYIHIFWGGVWTRKIRVFKEIVRKRFQNGSDLARQSHEKNSLSYVIANKRQQEKGLVEGDKGRIINVFKVGKGKKQTNRQSKTQNDKIYSEPTQTYCERLQFQNSEPRPNYIINFRRNLCRNAITSITRNIAWRIRIVMKKSSMVQVFVGDLFAPYWCMDVGLL